MATRVYVSIDQFDEETNRSFSTSTLNQDVLGDTWMEIVEVFEQALRGAGFTPKVGDHFVQILE